VVTAHSASHTIAQDGRRQNLDCKYPALRKRSDQDPTKTIFTFFSPPAAAFKTCTKEKDRNVTVQCECCNARGEPPPLHAPSLRHSPDHPRRQQSTKPTTTTIIVFCVHKAAAEAPTHTKETEGRLRMRRRTDCVHCVECSEYGTAQEARPSFQKNRKPTIFTFFFQ
jgi:hypothetical protein